MTFEIRKSPPKRATLECNDCLCFLPVWALDLILGQIKGYTIYRVSSNLATCTCAMSTIANSVLQLFLQLYTKARLAQFLFSMTSITEVSLI